MFFQVHELTNSFFQQPYCLFNHRILISQLYGGAVASTILTALNRLCLFYLQLNGHTISSKEFLTPLTVANKRRKELSKLVASAPQKVLEKLQMDREQFLHFWENNHVKSEQKNMALIDGAYTQVLGKTTSQITAWVNFSFNFSAKIGLFLILKFFK